MRLYVVAKEGDDAVDSVPEVRGVGEFADSFNQEVIKLVLGLFCQNAQNLKKVVGLFWNKDLSIRQDLDVRGDLHKKRQVLE